jgi:uncharacterized RDD family membrane protein YckC
MSEDETPVPGWYADPRGEASLRWWNGRAWTEQTAASPGGGAFAPPLVPGAEPTSGQDSGAPQPADVPAPAQSLAVTGPPTVVIAGQTRLLSAWWPRAGAYIIDALITFAFTLPFIIAAIVIVAGVDFSSIKIVDNQIEGISTEDQAAVGGAVLLVFFGALLVAFTYQPIAMARKGEQNGRTWGMQLLGIRVVRENGEAMTYGPALVRQFLVMGVLYGVISGIGNAVTVVGGTIAIVLAYLWPLWDSENRAAQDFICSTHVVRD